MAQLGRALRSGRRGRRFKSCRIDYKKRLSYELIRVTASNSFIWLPNPIDKALSLKRFHNKGIRPELQCLFHIAFLRQC